MQFPVRVRYKIDVESFMFLINRVAHFSVSPLHVLEAFVNFELFCNYFKILLYVYGVNFLSLKTICCLFSYVNNCKHNVL